MANSGSAVGIDVRPARTGIPKLGLKDPWHATAGLSSNGSIDQDSVPTPALTLARERGSDRTAFSVQVRSPQRRG
jgi:hypothetical protein